MAGSREERGGPLEKLAVSQSVSVSERVALACERPTNVRRTGNKATDMTI